MDGSDGRRGHHEADDTAHRKEETEDVQVARGVGYGDQTHVRGPDEYLKVLDRYHDPVEDQERVLLGLLASVHQFDDEELQRGADQVEGGNGDKQREQRVHARLHEREGEIGTEDRQRGVPDVEYSHHPPHQAEAERDGGIDAAE